MTTSADSPADALTLVDLAPDDPRWDAVLPVLQELRPHLTRPMLDTVLAEGTPLGLRYTVLLDGDRCLAVAGWRLVANTAVGRKLYVEDLCTAPAARSGGHGARLLHALVGRARELGCRTFELDSGVQRHGAHRFYLRERMRIEAHHFTLDLE